MADSPDAGLSVLDHPEVSLRLFHPRKEYNPGGAGINVSVPVGGDVVVCGRFYMKKLSNPNILFFHGNGEIVSEYDDMARLYNSLDINFMPMDYRGYGRSTGTPSVGAMINDSHAIYYFAKDWLGAQGFTGPLIVMGRSLGSASALEIGTTFFREVDGLILESAFAFVGPLLRRIGVDPEAIGFKEEMGFGNADKIKSFGKPVLIIHGEFDEIISFDEGVALFENCPSSDKTLLKIPGAGHNDIFLNGIKEYLSAVAKIASTVLENRKNIKQSGKE